MTICPWCGQQSQSDSTCDWCKRPIDRKVGPPPGTRSDLDFLKDESDVDRFGAIKIAAVVLCAVACGILLFFFLKGPTPKDNEVIVADTGGPAVPRATSTPASPRLISQPEFQSHPSDWWVGSWNNRPEIISNAYDPRWTRASPTAVSSASIPVNFPLNSPVKLSNVVVTMISLPGGAKRVAGSAQIMNTTDRNVIDYRLELIWGADEYLMLPLEGTRSKMHLVYQRSLKPGKKSAIQMVSLKLTNYPGGTPNAVRLTAWLDGPPGNAVDEYQLQFGR